MSATLTAPVGRVIQFSLAALGAGGYSPVSSRNLWSFVAEGIDLGPSQRELNDPDWSVTGVHAAPSCAIIPTGCGTEATAHRRRRRRRQPGSAPRDCRRKRGRKPRSEAQLV